MVQALKKRKKMAKHNAYWTDDKKKKIRCCTRQFPCLDILRYELVLQLYRGHGGSEILLIYLKMEG